MSDPKAPRLINTHDQLVAAGGGLAIVPAYLPGRSVQQCGWAIYKVDAGGQQITTDKNASWYDYGRKTFSGGGREGKAEALEAAKKWMAETYGEMGPWVRNALKDYIPARVHGQFPIKREG